MLTCNCAGRLHVVCRPRWKVDERRDPCIVAVTASAETHWQAYRAAHDATVPAL